VLLVAASATISVIGVRSMRAGALAQANAAEAEQQRAIAIAAQLFLQNMLVSAHKIGPDGMNVTILDVLASTTEQLNAGTLQPDPEVEAEVRYFLGLTYFRMSWTPLATEHFRKALEWYDATRPVGHTSRVQTLWFLGEAVKESGNLEEALILFERCYAEALEANTPGDSRIWFSLDQIGNTHYRLGHTAEALTYHQQAYDGLVAIFGRDSPYTGACLFNIGAVLQTLGRANEAEPLIVEAITLLERGASTQLLTAMRARNVLAMRILVPQGRVEEAEQLLLESRAFASRKLGPRHGETAGVEFSIGTLRRSQGRLDEALASFETYRVFIDSTRSASDQESLMIHTEIATVLLAQQDWQGAWDAFELVATRAAAGLAEFSEPAIPHRAEVLHAYAERADRGRAQVLLALGNPANAQAHAQMAMSRDAVSHPDDLTNSAGVEARRLWSVCRIQQGDAAAQVSWLRAALAATVARVGSQHAISARLADTLGLALWVTGHQEEGAALIASAAPVLEQDFGSRSVPRWPSSASQISVPSASNP
jgi:tetratricopeptide (TPR) repeat protein